MERVFVTGTGVVSALGIGVESSIAKLRNGESGIGSARHFTSKYTETLPFGEVDLSNEKLIDLTSCSDETGVSRTTLLAYLALGQAVDHSKLTSDELKSIRTGIISSTTVGGMCHTDELYTDANLKGEPSEYVRSYGLGEHTTRLIKKFEIGGFSSTINTACSSSANAVMLGARLIKSGRLDRVIVGGSDALAKFAVNGFNALMILSQNPCKPFDKNRDGLTLGEGAGYLVLEAESVCQNKEKLAEVVGYGNANDAFHPSTTSEEAFGPCYAMQRALDSCKMNPNQIDYINAHGTGTVNNDETELFAFHKIFGDIPAFNSTKSYTGHTLAASGAIESVFSIAMMNNNELYTNLRCLEPLDTFGTPQILKYKSGVEINNIMTNSFGFGGNCTSVIYSKV